MDAKVVPGPGANGRVDAATAANNASRHSIQSVDRALHAARSDRRSRRRGTLTELSPPHAAQHLDLPSPALDAGASAAMSRRCRASAPTRSARAFSISAMPALQVDLPRRAQPYHRADQRGDRRDRASRRAAGRRHDEDREARSASCRARRYRHARQDRCAARDRERQGDARLAARGRHPPHASAKDLQALHAPRPSPSSAALIEALRLRAPQRLRDGSTRSISPA